MKLVVRHSFFAAGGLGGVMHFLNAQQTRKVRGVLASDILGALANRLSMQTALDPSEPWISMQPAGGLFQPRRGNSLRRNFFSVK